MKNKIKKIFLCIVCMVLMCNYMQLTYASIGASDGKGYVSKAQFDKVLTNINERLSYFKETAKIEQQVDEYLLSNYYKKIEADILLDNKQNNILDISGSAGQVLKRNATNDGLEFGDIGEYYAKTEVDTLLDDKQNDILDLSGSAGQVLKRNATNNGLEFGDIGEYYAKTEVDTLLDNKQNNILTNITGSAGQVLKRNSSNNGLEFAMASGESLYQHFINIKFNSEKDQRIACSVINNVSTAYNFTSFVSFLYTNGFTAVGKQYMCAGVIEKTGASTTYITGIFASNTTSITYHKYGNSNTVENSVYAFSDTVIQIQ